MAEEPDTFLVPKEFFSSELVTGWYFQSELLTEGLRSRILIIAVTLLLEV